MFEKFKFIMSEIWGFLKPFALQLLKDSGKILATAAMTAVTAVAESMGDEDGSAKREAAFEMIVEDLKSQGIEVASHMVNAALEAAVCKLKADEA